MSDELIEHTDEDAIRALLVGRRVLSLQGSENLGDACLTLDDGTVLEIIPNSGCGGCASGNYSIADIDEIPDNAITDVEFEEAEDGEDDDGWPAHSYIINVLTFDKRVKMVVIEGTDGNGCYGTGYKIRVRGRS